MVPPGVMSLFVYGLGIWLSELTVGILFTETADASIDPDTCFPLAPVVDLMNDINGILCDILTRLNDLCSIEGVSVFRVSSPHVGFVVAFYQCHGSDIRYAVCR